MNKVIVRAPVRADLAGGTLDLWPLYLFHPGSRTVNVAISYYAESEVCETGTGGIEIHLTDQQYKQHYGSMQELAADPKAALLYRALEHFKLTGIRITTRTDAPRGSGLGGSSALSITLVRALSEIAGQPIEGEDL
ncbi:MAG TPA: galactokinase, partial [Thermoanaerobaculia bacterium]